MKRLIISAFVASSIAMNCFAQDLVQWRGPHRNGIYDETNLLKVWPADGPKLLWNYDGLGKGFTSVLIVKDKIYTTGETDGVGSLFAFDMQGKLLWKVEYGKEWNGQYPGSRTTPEFYKGKLYMLTGLGEALCINPETGKKIWSIDLIQKFGGRNISFGYVEAPVFNGNKVYFTPGGDSVSVVALNIETGETIWKSSATNEMTAYCSPLIFDFKGKKYFVTSLTDHIICLDAESGSLVWKVSQKNRYNIHPNTPIFKDGYLYNVTGYHVGGVMLKIADDGNSVTELWRNESLDNQIGGAVWIGNNIIGSGHETDRNWQSLDWQTGKVVHKTDTVGKGVVIYDDGLLYCYGDNGDLAIMEYKNTGFELKSKFKIKMGTEQHWAHPVIEKGVLYIRHGNTLLAYSLK